MQTRKAYTHAGCHGWGHVYCAACGSVLSTSDVGSSWFCGCLDVEGMRLYAPIATTELVIESVPCNCLDDGAKVITVSGAFDDLTADEAARLFAETGELQ